MTAGTGPAREKPLRATVEEARKAPLPPGRRSALLMEHGTMTLRWYAPRGTDPQTPHDQDELYLVHKGRGYFRCGRRRTEFGPGDVLFAAAGETHRFEEFSDELELWVVFWGAKGGEAP
jgi:mannose-6-phosphate isomerase-like protein (cupin superfamily)